ncbi:MAG: hypothetical protein LPK45_07810 [Bacteroidota bacterium]|nr:hypothetical protein [Bacteroidota bacterium]MDX5430975.1 hypothetical protein [Bacteroidota bacterium]MDX5469726.1 hypothetical protein [Bacteroidota bacterium]
MGKVSGLIQLKEAAFLMILLLSLSSAVPVETLPAEPFVVFISSDSTEKELRLQETKMEDFQDSILRAEFRLGDRVINVKGSILFVTKDKQAIVYPKFTGNLQFTKQLQTLCRSKNFVKETQLAITGLEELGTKKKVEDTSVFY